MYIADFHIHSRYSYATSKTCTLEYLDLWARRKGIHIVGTGDFTHPAWRAELKEKLAPAEDGLYILKEEYRLYDEADGKKNRRIRAWTKRDDSAFYYKWGNQFGV